MELSPGTEIAGFVLEEQIGFGGMGQVFRAQQVSLQRPVALKVIRSDIADAEDMRQRFIIEARTTAQLEHPNVVPIIEVGQFEDVLFIAMRLIDGPSLAMVIGKEVFLDADRAVSIVSQVASALAVAHERGFVHRDVKPANILLASHAGHEHAYLADFGLARFAAMSGITRPGESVGTPAYMAPEQVRGERTVDGRADIYALGCVLFETLTGNPPFPREETHAIYYAHLEADRPRCSEFNSAVDPAFDSIVATAMAKAPEDRYASATELADACFDALRQVRQAKPTAVPEGISFKAVVSSDPWLVVQLDAEAPCAHRSVSCPTLRGVLVPPAGVRFAGRGTAGWMRTPDVRELDGLTLCPVCGYDSVATG